MDASKAVVLGLGAVCLVFVLRNLAGAPSRFGVVTGRISMLAFATFAAFCFWKARELRLASAPSDIVWGMQRLLLGCGLAMILSAYSVAVQRRKMKAQKPPPVSGPS
jgi:hypothetical protein